MEQFKLRYGSQWPSTADDLAIELGCIKAIFEGTWKSPIPLWQHYRNAFSAAWPEDDHHRWSDLCLQRIVEKEIVVLLGPADSGKTDVMSKFVITDWWAFPEITIWLVSSTELRGAELRIWGKIKQLFNRARARYPWLPGSVLESYHCITTDEISDDQSEGRLMSKGIMFVPTKRGGQWVGMGCFPKGQLVDTPHGPTPIELIQDGDDVVGAFGTRTVNRTTVRIASSLVRVTLLDGRSFDCTPEHLIMTDLGWVPAIDLSPIHSVLSQDETLRDMWNANAGKRLSFPFLLREMQEGVLEKNMSLVQEEFCTKRTTSQVLQPVLWVVLERPSTGNKKEDSSQCEPCQTLPQWSVSVVEESREKTKNVGQNEAYLSIDGVEKQNKKRESRRGSSNSQSRVSAVGVVPRSNTRFPDYDRKEFQAEEHPTLFTGSCVARIENRRGGGRSLPQQPKTDGERSETRSFSQGARVDRVEILELHGDERYDESEGGYRVYNLEIEGHPSYSINGVLVHNSFVGIKPPPGGRMGHAGDEVQAMNRSFLDAYSNWYGKAHFKGLLAANPATPEDPAGIAAEPVTGWNAWQDSGKTQEWESKFYGAHVVDLDGRDTPNNDFPPDKPTRYPYLVGRKKMEAVKKMYGEFDWHWWNQCVGKLRPGAGANRIIPIALCEEGHAFDDVVWKGGGLTDIVGLDAAYGGIGGDRCVLQHVKYGLDVEENWILSCFSPVIVPVSVLKKEIKPEDQIANFCRDYCEAKNVPATNFFFDGRGTLAISLARLFDPAVNAVEFGGQATDRPISQDIFTWDGDTNTKRLKLCNEEYSKFVTELWFSVRLVIQCSQMRNLPREVADEGSKREWREVKGPRMEAETKAEMKERTQWSPDLMDALAIAVEGARRRGFRISKLANVDEDDDEKHRWLADMAKDNRKLFASKQLARR